MDQIQVRTTGRSGFVTAPRHLTEWDGLDVYDFRIGVWLSGHSDEYMDRVSLRGVGRRLGISKDRVAKSLDRLEALDVISLKHDGPRGSVQIVFYIEVWEGLGLSARKTDLSARRTEVSATRTVTVRHTDTKEEQEESKKNPPTPLGFDEFWETCPKKVGKGTAERAYLKALKKVGAEELLRGMESFAKEMAGKDRQFICHPATWLNGERWSDEASDARPPKPVDYADWNEDLHRWEWES